MSSPTLEDKIAAIAARGELVHISITPDRADPKKFEAKFCPASSMGYITCSDVDPVVALMGALDKVRLFSRKPKNLSLGQVGTHFTQPHTLTTGDALHEEHMRDIDKSIEESIADGRSVGPPPHEPTLRERLDAARAGFTPQQRDSGDEQP